MHDLRTILDIAAGDDVPSLDRTRITRAAARRRRRQVTRAAVVAISVAIAGTAVAAATTQAGGRDGLPADPPQAAASEGAADQQDRVSPEALDLLAPVDREAFQRSRSDLNQAVWQTVEPEWSSCVQRDGLAVDSDLGFELSSYGNAAAYDFMAPSVIRDQGGATRIRSAAAAALTSEEAASIQRCNDLVQSVLEGQSPSADGVDGSRLESARTALGILESEVSTFPRLYAELDRQVDDGEWQPAVDCLRDQDLEIPDAAADSPTATLESVDVGFDGSQSPAEAERLITEVQPRLDAYIDCSAAFYDGLANELTTFRTEALASDEAVFVELSAALGALDV